MSDLKINNLRRVSVWGTNVEENLTSSEGNNNIKESQLTTMSTVVAPKYNSTEKPSSRPKESESELMNTNIRVPKDKYKPTEKNPPCFEENLTFSEGNNDQTRIQESQVSTKSTEAATRCYSTRRAVSGLKESELEMMNTNIRVAKDKNKPTEKNTPPTATTRSRKIAQASITANEVEDDVDANVVSEVSLKMAVRPIVLPRKRKGVGFSEETDTRPVPAKKHTSNNNNGNYNDVLDSTTTTTTSSTVISSEDGLLAIHKGAADFFEWEVHKRKRTAKCSKTNQNTFIMPTPEDLAVYALHRPLLDPNYKALQDLRHSYREKHFPEWLWMLECGSNVCLIGCGCHRALLTDFCDICLEGEDVISIDCGFDENGPGKHKWIENLFTKIWEIIENGNHGMRKSLLKAWNEDIAKGNKRRACRRLSRLSSKWIGGSIVNEAKVIAENLNIYYGYDCTQKEVEEEDKEGNTSKEGNGNENEDEGGGEVGVGVVDDDDDDDTSHQKNKEKNMMNTSAATTATSTTTGIKAGVDTHDEVEVEVDKPDVKSVRYYVEEILAAMSNEEILNRADAYEILDRVVEKELEKSKTSKQEPLSPADEVYINTDDPRKEVLSNMIIDIIWSELDFDITDAMEEEELSMEIDKMVDEDTPRIKADIIRKEILDELDMDAIAQTMEKKKEHISKHLHNQNKRHELHRTNIDKTSSSSSDARCMYPGSNGLLLHTEKKKNDNDNEGDEEEEEKEEPGALYIILHELGDRISPFAGNSNNGLFSPTERTAHEALGVLSALSPAVRIVASLGPLDTALLWDGVTADRLRWITVLAPTYDNHRQLNKRFLKKILPARPSKKASTEGLEKGGDWSGDLGVGNTSWEFVLKSLSDRHMDLIKYILEVEAKSQMENERDGKLPGRGALFRKTYDLCHAKMLVKSETELGQLMKELIDQQILSSTSREDNKQVLYLNIPHTERAAD
eukprot:gene4610-9161_t